MATVQATVVALKSPQATGWAILTAEDASGATIKAVGMLAGLTPGQAVTLSGRWSSHPKFGDQLAVDAVEVGPPPPGRGILKWLAQTPGIGPKAARSICEALSKNGQNPLEVIRERPEELFKVNGIGDNRAKAIIEAVRKRSDKDRLWQQLVDHGVQLGAISKVMSRFGDDAADVVARSPYSLLKVRGMGWKTVDLIALGSGSVNPGSPSRIHAGVVETLNQAATKGHMYLPLQILLNGSRGSMIGATRLLNLKGETISGQLSELAEMRIIEIEDGAVYLAKHWRAESVVAGRLTALASVQVEPLSTAILEDPKGDIEFSQGQIDSIHSAAESAVTVITGGPGTGKTTITRAIVKMYQSAGLEIELAAPTGRAAKRLEEATGHEAKTIHRLLEYGPLGFARTRHDPLNCNALIVDEVSMNDTALTSGLLEAVPLGYRVVLVGDVDQLPSIGPGTVLHDIIASDAIPIVRLTDIFRQAKGSRIIQTAHAFSKGQPIDYPENGEESDFYFFRKNDPEDIKQALADFLLVQIPNHFGMDPLRDVMVLTPQNTGPLGTKELNRYLQQLINPNGQPLGNRFVRVGDRVMQIRNNYDLDVFNGNVGKILSWDVRSKTAHVELIGGRLVIYTSEHLGGLVPAYAATVHKSQGNGFPAVIGIIHRSHAFMLRRNLVYTMITRAERLLMLIGQRGALAEASRNTRDMERYTSLAERLRNPPERIPELNRAERIEDRLWTCDTCMHTFHSDSPQVFKCPKCDDPDHVRELAEDG